MVRRRVFSFARAFARARVAAFVRKLLPDPRDARYPRSLWFSLLRESVSCGWVVLAGVYLGAVLTSGVLQVIHRGVASLGDAALVAHLLLLDRLLRLLPVMGSHLWLLGSLLGVVGLLLAAWRWAGDDAARESKVLVMRVLQGPTSWQRVQTIGRLGVRWLRRQALLALLVVSSVLVGIALALVASVA
jgi:hypothetical protein